MFATEYTTIARRVLVLSIELLVPLAIMSKLDISFLPSGFSIETIYNLVHSLVECTMQSHRYLLIDKRHSVKFSILVHI